MKLEHHERKLGTKVHFVVLALILTNECGVCIRKPTCIDLFISSQMLFRDFFLDNFDNFLECLANFFRYFFLKGIRDCDIGLMTNFFMFGNTLLNFFVVAFGCRFVVNFGFVNWFVRFPVRVGFRGAVRMGYRAIKVRFSIK